LAATNVAPFTPSVASRWMVFDQPPPQPMIDMLILIDSTNLLSSSSSSLVMEHPIPEANGSYAAAMLSARLANEFMCIPKLDEPSIQ